LRIKESRLFLQYKFLIKILNFFYSLKLNKMNTQKSFKTAKAEIIEIVKNNITLKVNQLCLLPEIRSYGIETSYILCLIEEARKQVNHK